VLACLAWWCVSAQAESTLPNEFEPAYSAQVQSLASLDHRVLKSFMTEAASGRYYEDGTWHNPTLQASCWWCLDGAGTAAAILSRRHEAGDSALVSVAEATFNQAIAEYQLPDGAFQSEGNPSEITTGFELIELGVAYLELRSVLPASTRAKWAAAVEGAADYLLNSGAMTWYINGNIQLHQVEDMWLAWQITGAERFQAAYESEWSFTIAPPQTRWTGFGLQLTRTPTRSDGADGAGYLAESAGAAPGFDPEYTTLQLDYASSLWVLTHEERYLRLANLLFNQLRPLVNAHNILDAEGGTRKNDTLPFFSMGPVVLLDSGDRPDLAEFVATQLPEVTGEYENPDIYDNLNFYRGLSIWLSLPLLFEQWPGGIDGSAPATPAEVLERRSTRHADTVKRIRGGKARRASRAGVGRS
jgi:hypothetical protein